MSPAARLALVSRHVPFWLSLALVMAMGYYLARLFWLVIPAAPATVWVPPSSAARARAAETDGGDYSAIINAHLFGEPPAEAAPAMPVMEAAPTTLNLELRGVVASSDARFAHAIIAEESGKEQVYVLEDELPGGATLYQVQADRVILKRGARLEALLLPRDSGESTVGTSLAAAGGAAAKGVEDEAPADPLAVPPRPAIVGDVVMHRPLMRRGRLKGYQVFPGENREQFAAFGLQSGDIITAIDGAPMTAGSEAVFQSLVATADLTFTVDRRGRSETLTLAEGQLVRTGVPP